MNYHTSVEALQALAAKDLFMVCHELNQAALCALPFEYHVRNCRRDELDLWKRMHFDIPQEADQYFDFMTDYFARVYAPQEDVFFERCLLACDTSDQPVGTVFIWKAYNAFNAIHWFKVVKSHEGNRIGRGLLSQVMAILSLDDFPVYLHTHPSSYRAIKLYSDFGFQFITNPRIGQRSNDIKLALPYLEKLMPHNVYTALQMTEVTQDFIQLMALQSEDEF